MKKIFVSILGVFIILTMVSTGCGGGGKMQSVTVDTVTVRNITESVSASGKIQPEVEVKISSDVSGQIVELYVKEGDSVQQGQLLLVINPDLYESEYERMQAVLNQTKANYHAAKSQLDQLKAQLLQAEDNKNRNEPLFKKGVISQTEWDQINTTYKVALSQVRSSEENLMAADYTVKSTQASLTAAKDNLQRTRIFAPMSGVVSMLNVEKGERVVGTAQMQGTEMLRIANLSVMEVNVEVNENDIVKVDLGDTAFIEVDAYLNRKFVGVVTEIANSPKTSATALSTDEVTNFEVKIRILQSSYEDLLKKSHGSPFRPGMSATVDINTESVRNVIAVPIQSVTTRKDTLSTGAKDEYKEYVFVVNEGKVILTSVKTGVQDNRYIQVTEGLNEGQIVVEGPYTTISKLLEDGSKVKVKSKSEIYKHGK